MTKLTPFSILLAETEAELKELFDKFGGIDVSKIRLEQDVEDYLKALSTRTKVLKTLSKLGYTPVGRPKNESSKGVAVFRSSRRLDFDLNETPVINSDEQQLITVEIVKLNILSDIAEIAKDNPNVNLGYIKKKSKVFIHITGFIRRHQIIDTWVEAKSLPVVSKEKLIKVHLNDGNTAWLTEEAYALAKTEEERLKQTDG